MNMEHYMESHYIQIVMEMIIYIQQEELIGNIYKFDAQSG